VLSATEREIILAALVTWAKDAPAEPVLGFLGSGEPLTPREIVSAVRRETDDGRAILEILEHGVRREGIAKVVERLTKLPAVA